MAVEGVADAPLEGSQRLLGRLAFGDLAVEEGAALAVAVADLGDGGDVDGVVELTVASPGDPVDLARPRGHLDRSGARVRGVSVPGRESGHVAGVADDHGGHDGADAEQLGEGGARGGDRLGDALLGLAASGHRGGAGRR